MNGKIVAFYGGIGVFAVVLIGVFSWLRMAQDARELATMEERVARDVGRQEKKVMLTLEKDLVAVNQAGEEVRLSDLKDKVWLAAQFFAECPMCAQRNGDHLLNFYHKYRKYEDFHVVCISIDPETDTPERLQEMAEAMNVRIDNWWFLTGPREELLEYMEQEMKFLSVKERRNPLEIDAKGRYAHDMRVAVYGKGMTLREIKDLFYAQEEGGEDMYAHFQGLLTGAIDKALAEVVDD